MKRTFLCFDRQSANHSYFGVLMPIQTKSTSSVCISSPSTRNSSSVSSLNGGQCVPTTLRLPNCSSHAFRSRSATPSLPPQQVMAHRTVRGFSHHRRKTRSIAALHLLGTFQTADLHTRHAVRKVYVEAVQKLHELFILVRVHCPCAPVAEMQNDTRGPAAQEASNSSNASANEFA